MADLIIHTRTTEWDGLLGDADKFLLDKFLAYIKPALDQAWQDACQGIPGQEVTNFYQLVNETQAALDLEMVGLGIDPIADATHLTQVQITAIIDAVRLLP